MIPTGRNAHSILPDRSNKFLYAATLGANQVLQFTFHSKTGKLTPQRSGGGQPGAGSRSAPHGALARQQEPLCDQRVVGVRHLYSVDSSKGTLTLVESYQLGAGGCRPHWGTPQAPVGAPPTPAMAPRKDRSQKSGRLTSKSRPTASFCIRPNVPPARSPCSRWLLEPASSPTWPISRPRRSRAASGSIRAASTLSRPVRVRSAAVYKLDQSTGKLGEPSRYPVGNGANWVEIVDVQ